MFIVLLVCIVCSGCLVVSDWLFEVFKLLALFYCVYGIGMVCVLVE